MDTRSAVSARGSVAEGTIAGVWSDAVSAGRPSPPQNLENALTTFPYIADALIVGDRQPYVAALIAVDPDEIASLAGGADVHALVAEAVPDVNGRLGRAGRIRRFALLPRPFSIEAGELTPTLKVKRRVCEPRFREEIEALYAATDQG